MKIPVPQPDLPKVFVLRTPQHWMAKLHWEIAGFKCAEKDRAELRGHLVLSYWAANCAITAWHMTDWVWSSISQSERQWLMELNDFSGSTFDRFQAGIRDSCSDLRYCWEIANGTKHFQVTNSKADAAVKAHQHWNIEQARAGQMRAGDPLTRFKVELSVMDGAEIKPAGEVFQGAFDYWDRFLRRAGFIEGRFVAGDN